jgi:hypothetical protein
LTRYEWGTARPNRVFDQPVDMNEPVKPRVDREGIAFGLRGCPRAA